MTAFKLIHSPVILPSSTANLRSPSETSTTIDLTWTQHPGEVADSFIILYSFSVIGCRGEDGSAMVQVAGSARSFTLTGLEEDSVFTISILARNAAGDSQPPPAIQVTTDIAGRPLLMAALLVVVTCLFPACSPLLSTSKSPGLLHLPHQHHHHMGPCPMCEQEC